MNDRAPPQTGQEQQWDRDYAITRKLARHYPEFQIGSHVGIRYNKNAFGRIVAIRIRRPNLYQQPFVVFEIAMEDGATRQEHPEHLSPAHPPQINTAA